MHVVDRSYYLASKLENIQRVRVIHGFLRQWGWSVTYDWTAHGSVQTDNAERKAEVAENEIDGVRRASIVPVLLPGGRGTHVELGGGVILRKPVLLLYDDPALLTDKYTCVFYSHRTVRHVPFIGMDDLCESLLAAIEETYARLCGTQ